MAAIPYLRLWDNHSLGLKCCQGINAQEHCEVFKRENRSAKLAQAMVGMAVLTFMSIRAHITSLEADGKLLRYLPRSRHPPKRRLFLTEAAVNDLISPNSAVNLLGLRGLIRADLDTWVLGGLVHSDEDGNPCFLKPLCPPPPPCEIWELRVTEPRVHVRLFCRFAEPDTLIMNKFYTRGLLGKRGSQQWKEARDLCANTWIDLFSDFTPFHSNWMHEYVTENCDDFEVCPP